MGRGRVRGALSWPRLHHRQVHRTDIGGAHAHTRTCHHTGRDGRHAPQAAGIARFDRHIISLPGGQVEVGAGERCGSGAGPVHHFAAAGGGTDGVTVAVDGGLGVADRPGGAQLTQAVPAHRLTVGAGDGVVSLTAPA